MSKATVTALVSSLSAGLSDTTTVSDYYDKVVLEHGQQRESLVDAAFVAGVAGTFNYALPTGAIRGLGFFYDNVWLYNENKRGAELHSVLWRARRGQPRAVLFEDANQLSVDLVPTPALSGDTIGADTPFTATFPRNNLTVVYTSNAAAVQSWEELFIAFEILAREFARDSDHQDVKAANVWRQLANLAKRLIDG